MNYSCQLVITSVLSISLMLPTYYHEYLLQIIPLHLTKLQDFLSKISVIKYELVRLSTPVAMATDKT